MGAQREQAQNFQKYVHRTVLDALMRDPAVPLFHYTSQEGLLGILGSRSLWATNISYLNDSAENSHAIAHVISVAEEAENRPGTPAILKHFCEKVREIAPKIATLPRLVISFSEKGDLLSQWRAYCPGNSGFSIGFTKRQVIDKFLAFPGGLYKCEYDAAIQRSWIKALFDSAFSDFEKTGGKEMVPEVPEAEANIFSFILNVGIIAPSFKDAAFSEEQEWRFISSSVIPDDRLKFRPGKSMIIPYAEVNLCKVDGELEIEQIYVGPTPNMSLAVQSVERLVGGRKIKVIQGIKASSIPYRQW